MGDVRQGDEGMIIGRRQFAVVNRTQPAPPNLPEMEMPNGLHRVLWQLIQQAQIIQNLLSVRLENFSAYAMRRAGGLLKDESVNPLLGEQQTQDCPSTSGTDYNDVNVNIHPIRGERSETNGSGAQLPGETT